MNAERISRLHEQASEYYLNGDYPAALASWQEVLAMDPGNEEALEGARMASQFSEQQPTPVEAARPDLEHDVEAGLRVLDSLGAKPPEPAAFELGHPSQVDAAPVMTAMEEGWEPSSRDEVSFGLAPAPATSDDAAPAAPTAAAVELRRRVDDLLAQARSRIEAGEKDEALAILARVSILDEENAEAVSIREQLEASGRTDLDRIEQAIIEGVAALESERLDDADRHFNEALTLSPDHREALHYLEQVASRRTAAVAAAAKAPAEDHFGDDAAFGGDLPEASPAASEPPVVPIASKPRPSRPLPPSLPEPQRPLGRRSLPPLKTLLMIGVGGAVLVGAFLAVPMFLGGGEATAPSAPPAQPAASNPAGTKPEPAATAAAPAPAGGAPNAGAAIRSVEKARRLTESGDIAGAVVAYNEAVTLDPTNLDARSGLATASAQYKAQKADQDALKAIESAFAGGEYASGLRLTYRLPGTVDPARIDRVKAAGWYNLAIVALRAGDCRGAIGNLDEVLGVAGEDAEAIKLKEFAARYADVPKDRAFLDTVEALPFRPFP